jgi:hypothetical protein
VHGVLLSSTGMLTAFIPQPQGDLAMKIEEVVKRYFQYRRAVEKRNITHPSPHWRRHFTPVKCWRMALGLD